MEGVVPAEVAAVTVPGRARVTNSSADSGRSGRYQPEGAKPSPTSAIWQRSG